jgi:hypothetical protein
MAKAGEGCNCGESYNSLDLVLQTSFFSSTLLAPD